MLTATTHVTQDIVPLFAFDPKGVSLPEFLGTAFVPASRVLVTCWHCVRDLVGGPKDIVAMSRMPDGQPKPLLLSNIERDGNGADLALATVDAEPTIGLYMGDSDHAMGTDVLSFGYPGTEVITDGEAPSIDVVPRYLQGYITRVFENAQPGYGPVPSYELDMPAPRGLSGGPLIRRGSSELVGVVYGEKDFGTIDCVRSVDPVTGKETPEQVRVQVFGLAHRVAALRQLAGKATGGRPLCELMELT